MTIRAAFRLVWVLFKVMIVVARYFIFVLPVGRKKKLAARAAWLSQGCQQQLKAFHCRTKVIGTIPKTGLLICNHLSYFDILFLSAVTPAVFVSKAEVQGWPLFGWLAKRAGTVFIERERRMHVGAVNQEIKAALADGILVVVFPEGTSTNGEQVLPFRSSLLEPAASGTQPITVGYLHYELDDGDARNELCYWGDHMFFPHLLHLLSKGGIQATVRFGPFERTTNDRKELAKQLHAAVVDLAQSK
jgi:lyso-ornithine lipid O-acyltransferase